MPQRFQGELKTQGEKQEDNPDLRQGPYLLNFADQTKTIGTDSDAADKVTQDDRQAEAAGNYPPDKGDNQDCDQGDKIQIYPPPLKDRVLCYSNTGFNGRTVFSGIKDIVISRRRPTIDIVAIEMRWAHLFPEGLFLAKNHRVIK